MKKFLKICFKVNIILSILMMIYCCIAFFASLFNITAILNYIGVIMQFSTFGIINPTTTSIVEVLGFGLFSFLDNQYFYKAYKTLYNFDKFREITGIKIIPIFGIFQTLMNGFFIGIFALIPYIVNIVGTICLHIYQSGNRKKLISEYDPNQPLVDPTMQEMSLKIGQLRTLKSEGKISEEEFMFHLNNILENKE